MRWLETSEGYSLQQDPPLIWVNRLAVYLGEVGDWHSPGKWAIR